MNLKLCFITPEQEELIDENTEYSVHDRQALSLLVNGICDLIYILEIYELDNPKEINYLTTFQLLKHLMGPVQKYLSQTFGVSLEDEKEEEATA